MTTGGQVSIQVRHYRSLGNYRLGITVLSKGNPDLTHCYGWRIVRTMRQLQSRTFLNESWQFKINSRIRADVHKAVRLVKTFYDVLTSQQENSSLRTDAKAHIAFETLKLSGREHRCYRSSLGECKEQLHTVFSQGRKLGSPFRCAWSLPGSQGSGQVEDVEDYQPTEKRA